MLLNYLRQNSHFTFRTHVQHMSMNIQYILLAAIPFHYACTTWTGRDSMYMGAIASVVMLHCSIHVMYGIYVYVWSSSLSGRR